jgi:alkyl hydroperoxide reductase subunit AhpF
LRSSDQMWLDLKIGRSEVRSSVILLVLINLCLKDNVGNLLAADSKKPSEWLAKLPTREEQIEIMSKFPEYDVLVVGGGCTGAGVALDSISRGIANTLAVNQMIIHIQNSKLLSLRPQDGIG